MVPILESKYIRDYSIHRVNYFLSIFLTVLILDFVEFVNNQKEKMQMKFNVQTFINLMCIHQVLWYHYFCCLILFYYQIATNETLKTMSNELKVGYQIMNLEYFLQKLRTMSIVSEKFNDMIGFPIITCCMVKTIFKQMLDEQLVRGRNRILRWSLIDLYYDSFQLRLFRLSQITFPFILSVTVFILNYVVLLLQTN
ncbi:hypothetical protein BLOT_013468 [Blomia tropicalis]|nr:hypothetical protein BLOT_013468 [Blomia tropicalis]